jgi:hypothetical protein
MEVSDSAEPSDWRRGGRQKEGASVVQGRQGNSRTTKSIWWGSNMKLLLLLALLLTLDACQNPGRFHGPQIGPLMDFAHNR